MHMSELKDIITSYNNLPFSDRIVFFTTIYRVFYHDLK